MSQKLYVAGEFYGIQKYVLGITAAGAGQAKRLRARSFVVQVLEEIAVDELGELGDIQVVMSGGGQFVLALATGEDMRARLLAFRAEFQRRLFEELGGELSFNLGWAESEADARRARAGERRRPWAAIMTGPDGWIHKPMRFSDIFPPCDVCRKRPATEEWAADGPPESVCKRCDADRRIGAEIPRVEGVRLTEQNAEAHLLGRGIRFVRPGDGGPGRMLHRHVPVHPNGNSLVTFEEIAAKAIGDDLLGVLKADVDDFGALIARHSQAGSLEELHRISRDLDGFFSAAVQRMIVESPEWKPAVYTVFSGGDDLLLVGPWDKMLDFAAALEQAFSAGPGRLYNLKLSAAVSFMPPRIPIRHGVERAEEDLKKAKAGSKNRCVTLHGVWGWETLRRTLGEGRELVRWWECHAANRDVLRRLYRYTTTDKPAAHLWAWELRNFGSPRFEEARLFRLWGKAVLANWEKPSREETRAALLYALTATRTRSH
jgi:CRISPR-associated protein Csm1